MRQVCQFARTITCHFVVKPGSKQQGHVVTECEMKLSKFTLIFKNNQPFLTEYVNYNVLKLL